MTSGSRSDGAWAVLAGLACALAVMAVFKVNWWHPYCDAQADGPGHYARGFPLPFVAPSGASSLDYVFMPHVLLLNLALLFGPFLLLARRLARSARIVVFVAAGLVAIGLCGPRLLVGEYRPTLSVGGGYDSYFSYRPARLAERTGHKACDAFW